MAKKVGTLIKEARTAAGLSQEQLARKIKGLSAGELARAESGESELTQALLKEIAKATGVTQSSLLSAARADAGKKTTSSAKTATAKKTTTAAKTTTAKKASTAKKAIQEPRLLFVCVITPPPFRPCPRSSHRRARWV